MKQRQDISRPPSLNAAFTFAMALLLAFSATVAAQSGECEDCGSKTKLLQEEQTIVRKVGPVVRAIAAKGIGRPSVAPSPRLEKAITVLPNVYVSVCVRRGAVKINGWDRNEVRVFHEGGDDLGLKVLERNSKNVPAWVEVLGHDPKSKKTRAEKCVVGDVIELDVPNGASVTLKGLSSETSVESVSKASIEIVGGDIYLNNISSRVDASTQQGGVTVNNSKGKVAVATTTGNIVAYNTVAVEPGDYFRAKTRSGSVTMQSIGQKEIVASTISGTINYIGEIKNYGRYEFTTTNGILNIAIPEDSCFTLAAAYGGRFLSDFQVDVLTENETESAFYIRGKVGSCEANLSLKSFSGTIRLRKREVPEATRVDVRVP